MDVNLKSASLDSGLPRQLVAMNIKSFGRIREKCCILMQLYFKPEKGCETSPRSTPELNSLKHIGILKGLQLQLGHHSEEFSGSFLQIDKKESIFTL